MKKSLYFIAIAAVVALIIVVTTTSAPAPIEVNKITTPEEVVDSAFESSQATSKSNSLTAIEADINNTVIQDEDFSDLE